MTAFKLSVAVFILPFAFVLRPEILGLPQLGIGTLFLSILILLSAFATAAALYGHFVMRLSAIERALLLAGTTGVFGYFVVPSIWFVLPVFLASGVIFIRQRQLIRGP